jgi:hypothetical protein
VESSSSTLERWDLYPFGERSPSKIWDQVAVHPAWTASPAQIAPYFLPAYQIEDGRLVTNLISSVWGERISTTRIRVAAYLFARIQVGAGNRNLRVLRCLAYQDDPLPLYRKVLAYLIGLGTIQRCSRIEWEILDPCPVAVPATFDLIGPCGSAGLREFLLRQGFGDEQRWTYRKGPLSCGRIPQQETDRSKSIDDQWKTYAGRHFTLLLPDPVPELDLKILGRFLPRGTVCNLFRPFGTGSIGQWIPDLTPLIENQGRWEEARLRVKTVRLLRLFNEREREMNPDRKLLLPESIPDLFPRAEHLEIGPLPGSDHRLARLLERAGYPSFTVLRIMTCPL